MKNLFETFVETFLFKSRWLLAPLYLGLAATLLALGFEFFEELIELLPNVHNLDYTQIILIVLSLVDIVLVANLVIMVIFSGYENFVSKIDKVAGNKNFIDRPEWMGRVSHSEIKLKIIGSIIAISAVELLKVFINISNVSQETVVLMIGIHLTLTVSGVLLALMEKLNPHQGKV